MIVPPVEIARDRASGRCAHHLPAHRLDDRRERVLHVADLLDLVLGST